MEIWNWLARIAGSSCCVLRAYFVSLAEYAQVLRMLGNGRLEAMCIDSTKRLCHIRGKMRKKVWVNTVRVGLQLQCWCFMVIASTSCCHSTQEKKGSCYKCLAVGLQGDIILVGLRDYQDEKADVILK